MCQTPFEMGALFCNFTNVNFSHLRIPAFKFNEKCTMNKRVKSEGRANGVVGTVRKPRAAAKNATSNRRASRQYVWRKRAPPLSHDSRKSRSSAEDFEYKPPMSYAKSNVPTSNYVVRHMTRESLPTYNISDSSDEEENNLTIAPVTAVVDLSDSVLESKNDILHEVVEAATKKDAHSVYPSTSTCQEISSGTNSNFINNLLCSSEDLLSENNLKPFEDIHEQTEKLLATSWALINDGIKSNFDDSVVYVCTEEKSQAATQSKESGTEQAGVTTIDLSNESASPKLNKPSCPICLEEIGKGSVSSTICGHIFCTPCIENCVKTMKKCPTCRRRLTCKMVHPLFLF